MGVQISEPHAEGFYYRGGKKYRTEGPVVFPEVAWNFSRAQSSAFAYLAQVTENMAGMEMCLTTDGVWLLKQSTRRRIVPI